MPTPIHDLMNSLSEKSEPNWVERRFATETALLNDTPRVWAAVTEALRAACQSFTERYDQSVEFKREQDRIEISYQVLADRVQSFQDRNVQVAVTLENARSKPKIRVVTKDMIQIGYQAPAKPIDNSYAISSNENEAFVVDGSARVSADDLSMKILKPVFFRG